MKNVGKGLKNEKEMNFEEQREERRRDGNRYIGVGTGRKTILGP